MRLIQRWRLFHVDHRWPCVERPSRTPHPMLSWYLNVEILATQSTNNAGENANAIQSQFQAPEYSDYRRLSRLRNSSLVFALDRIAPSMQLVVVEEVVF